MPIFFNQNLQYNLGQSAKTKLLVRSMPGPGHKNGALPVRISSRALEVVSSCRQCWNDEFFFHAGQYSDRTSSLCPTLLLASFVFGRHSPFLECLEVSPESFNCDTAKFPSKLVFVAVTIRQRLKLKMADCTKFDQEYSTHRWSFQPQVGWDHRHSPSIGDLRTC